MQKNDWQCYNYVRLSVHVFFPVHLDTCQTRPDRRPITPSPTLLPTLHIMTRTHNAPTLTSRLSSYVVIIRSNQSMPSFPGGRACTYNSYQC